MGGAPWPGQRAPLARGLPFGGSPALGRRHTCLTAPPKGPTEARRARPSHPHCMHHRVSTRIRSHRTHGGATTAWVLAPHSGHRTRSGSRRTLITKTAAAMAKQMPARSMSVMSGGRVEGTP